MDTKENNGVAVRTGANEQDVWPELVYEVETGNGLNTRRLPFVIGVLADLSGRSSQNEKKVRDRKFIQCDLNNINEVLAGQKPSAVVADPFDSVQSLELEFRKLADFHPVDIAQRIDGLARLLETRQALSALLAKLPGNHALVDLLGQLLPSQLKNAEREHIAATSTYLRSEESKALKLDDVIQASAQSSEALDELENLISAASDTFGSEALGQQVISLLGYSAHVNVDIGTGLESALRGEIAALDELLSSKVSRVLHDPAVQQIESTWRGLQFLLSQIGDTTEVKVKVLHVSKEELMTQLPDGSDVRESEIYAKLFDAELIAGGEFYDCLIVDHEFACVPDDLLLLHQLARVSGACATPVLSAAAAGLFNMDDWADLVRPRDLKKIFDSGNPEYKLWHALRESPESENLVLAMPRMLMRQPFTPDSLPGREFAFTEETAASADFLWGNPAFALAGNLASAFRKYRWCRNISGPRSGGVVNNIPIHRERAPAGNERWMGPVEAFINDRRLGELLDLGFTPLVGFSHFDAASFFRVQSLRKCKVFSDWQGVRDTKWMAAAEIELVGSRVLHVVLSWLNNKGWGYGNINQIRDELHSWLKNYVIAGEDMASHSRPLRAIEVEADVAASQLQLAVRPDIRGAALDTWLRWRIGLGATSIIRIARVSDTDNSESDA
jgi:type VI secretion system protein ImpC